MHPLPSRPTAKMTAGPAAGEPAEAGPFQRWPGGGYFLPALPPSPRANNLWLQDSLYWDHGISRYLPGAESADRGQGQLCSFLRRPQSAADDDTSSELQRLAEMDAPQQRRGGFHRWVPPLPCCYPILPLGPVRVARMALLLSVTLGLSDQWGALSL